MKKPIVPTLFLLIFLILPAFLFAQNIQVLTNQIGYEINKPKQAVIEAQTKVAITSFQLINTANNKTVYSGKPVYSGAVNNWKNRLFWTIDFSAYKITGNYILQVSTPQKTVASYPFFIGTNVLEQYTLSDVLYYFKGQRSSGLFNQADAHLSFTGNDTAATIDAHGGWYDATGDYGKHLSHLSFSSYFNPQQISLTAWSLLKTYELLNKRPGTDFRQVKRRVLDEAVYGADYLVRVQAKDGSFYRSVGAPGPGKFAKDRGIQPEQKSYRIKQNKEQSFSDKPIAEKWSSYQVSFRSGGGLAIAALALAASFDTAGDFSKADYLKAAETAFAFLQKNNAQMTNDGKENIVDDYCALSAATELYKTTKKQEYLQAADKRALQLLQRLISWKNYKDYWRADDASRPFFHPSDAGLPLVSLLYFYPVAPATTQQQIKEVVQRSLAFELQVTHEVNNPFNYSRQLVQDTLGNRRSSFFFPHGSDASPWWQGENARLGSMAAAARLAANTLYVNDKQMADTLQGFALSQLNWILGLNPFDACMLQGSGHNNPGYGFFGTFEYTNAPGGIVNGITSGLDNEDDISFNLSYAQTGKDYDWRWAEQWLPHAAWYMLAVALGE